MMQYLASGPIVAGMLLAVSVTIVGAAQGAQPGGVGPEHTVSVPDAAPQVPSSPSGRPAQPQGRSPSVGGILGSDNQPSAGATGAVPDSETDKSPYRFYRPGDALRSGSDPLIATVGGRNIYLSEVGDAYKQLPDDSRQQPFDLVFPLLVEGLINQSALILEAQSLHLDEDPDVRRRMANAADMAMVNEMLSRAAAKEITDAAIRARYDQRYAGQAGIEEAHLRVIVLATFAKAQEMQADLAKGGDFATLARQHSIDPSGANGGDIGFVQRQQLPAVVADAVFALPMGGISPSPVLNQNSWDVFKLEARRTASPPTFEQARDSIRQELLQELVKANAAQARATLEIREYNVDGTPFKPPDQGFLDMPFNFRTSLQPSK